MTANNKERHNITHVYKVYTSVPNDDVHWLSSCYIRPLKLEREQEQPEGEEEQQEKKY